MRLFFLQARGSRAVRRAVSSDREGAASSFRASRGRVGRSPKKVCHTPHPSFARDSLIPLARRSLTLQASGLSARPPEGRGLPEKTLPLPLPPRRGVRREKYIIFFQAWKKSAARLSPLQASGRVRQRAGRTARTARNVCIHIHIHTSGECVYTHTHKVRRVASRRRFFREKWNIGYRPCREAHEPLANIERNALFGGWNKW